MRSPNEIVVEYLAEVWTGGAPGRAAEFIHDDYDLGDLGRGPAAVAENLATFRRAFPDMSIAVDELVADGERVAVWMRLAGTHRGEFRGYGPTGRHVTWDEVGFFTVREDRIVAGRFLADMFGLRKALGVLPADMR